MRCYEIRQGDTAGANMRVLLAVDNAGLARLLEVGLVEAGHHVEYADIGCRRTLPAMDTTYDAMISNRIASEVISGLAMIAPLPSAGDKVRVLLFSGPDSGSDPEIAPPEAHQDSVRTGFRFRDLVARLNALTAQARRQSEVRLRDSQKMLAQVQSMSGTGSWLWNIETGEIWITKETESIFKFLGQGNQRKTIDWLLRAIHPADKTSVAQTLSAAADHQQNFEVSFRISDQGTTRHFRTIGERQSDEDGGVYYLCASMDVSERERREGALHQAHAEIAHLTRIHTLGKLSSSIVHEVTQPLAAIATYSTAALNWLHRREPDLSEVSIGLRKIIRDVARTKEVIARMRKLSKNGQPRKVQFSIGELVEETFVLLGHEFVARNITVNTIIEPSLPQVTGDRVQIQQVLINLILNAAEALEDIHSRARAITVLVEEVTARRLRILVRDNGTGVTPDARERLFEPFFSTKNDGLGVGLSICRSIIEEHEGVLALSPCEAPGAAFEFVLPVTEET
jgi:signal transduction histidine kinase